MIKTMSTTRYIRAAVLALSVVLMSCSEDHADRSGTSVRSNDETQLFAPDADSDSFYNWTEPLPRQPGTLLKHRSISYSPAGISVPTTAWQIQYVTQSASGEPLAAVTTVLQPLLPNLYSHAVLVSFQHAYDSLGAPCTPSHTATGDTRNTTNMAETLEYLGPLLALGWTVIIPDYEGPLHAFGAGPLSGRATLDSIRAVLQLDALGLPADTPIGLWGYSGGAFATTWAAALHPSYAPELKLVGAVAGGTPVDMFRLARHTENTNSFNLSFTIMIGMTREYPNLLSFNTLTARGKEAVTTLRNACVATAEDGTTLPAAQMSDYVAAADPYSTPAFQNVMPSVILTRVKQHPITDIYLYHELHDALVPVEEADNLAAHWCALGVPLSYYKSDAAAVANSAPLGTHTAGAAVGTPAAIAYLASRFGGTTAPITPVGTVRCN